MTGAIGIYDNWSLWNRTMMVPNTMISHMTIVKE